MRIGFYRDVSFDKKMRVGFYRDVSFDKKMRVGFYHDVLFDKKRASDFTATFYLIKNARGNPFKTYRYTYSAPEKLHVQLKYAIIFGCFCKYT